MSEGKPRTFRDNLRLAVGAGGAVTDGILVAALATESIQHSTPVRLALGAGMVAVGQATPVLERMAGLNILASSAGRSLRNGK